MDKSRPAPDLLRLWDARSQAEDAAFCAPHSIAVCDLNRLTAAARCSEKRLSRSCWLDWCASLWPFRHYGLTGVPTVQRSAERAPLDPASSACLASGRDPPQYAPEVARSFFSDFH